MLGEAGPGKSVVLAPVRMMVKFEWKVEFVGTAAEEKKKAEARARAAYRRRQRKFEENGVIEGFAQINWSFMAARDELKRRNLWETRGDGPHKTPVFQAFCVMQPDFSLLPRQFPRDSAQRITENTR